MRHATGASHFVFNLRIYVVPIESYPVTIPFHKCGGTIVSGNKVVTDVTEIKMDSPRAKRQKIVSLLVPPMFTKPLPKSMFGWPMKVSKELKMRS